ncbi:hypothetical protein B0H11DRAFT_2231765 [Mycena galericulata]|nr:hypothetical protein B0H11DRAFT_2231765 [Mycena galericulata]
MVHPRPPTPFHTTRLKRLLLPALLALSGLLVLAVLLGDTDSAELVDAFPHVKLYLILVFVRLLVMLILAVMLSVWCCRGVTRAT